MKKIGICFFVFLVSFLILGCGKPMCSVEGCENEAVDESVYEEELCSKHVALKKAFDASKVAYDYVDTAYEILEQMGSDIYEAWRLGIYDDDEIISKGIEHLATELSLSEDEIGRGIAYVIAVELGGFEWSSVTEDDIKLCIENDTLLFKAMEDDLFSICVEVVIGAYNANGKMEKVQTALNDAKTKMKELSENYSDYEHYPNLKGYYTTTDSFFEFCQKPAGSFEQIKDTINDYKNEARDYISDLDYIFEE